MTICKNCGAAIKFIARRENYSVMVDAEETTVYTFSGREVVGHQKHICKGKEDGRKEGENK